MRRLIARVFKTFPFLFCGPDIFFGGFKLRQGRRFLRQDMRLLRPKNAAQHCGMRLESEVQADGTGDDQKNDETGENRTALAEASYPSPLGRRAFEPGIHFASDGDVSAAARNFW